MAHEHDAVSGRDAEDGHEPDERAERQDPSAEERREDASDQGGGQADEYEERQTPRLERGLEEQEHAE